VLQDNQALADARRFGRSNPASLRSGSDSDPTGIAATLGDRATRLTVVHRRSAAEVATMAIAPGVEALDISKFSAELNNR
jgi:hypothetical protein